MSLPRMKNSSDIQGTNACFIYAQKVPLWDYPFQSMVWRILSDFSDAMYFYTLFSLQKMLIVTITRFLFLYITTAIREEPSAVPVSSQTTNILALGLHFDVSFVHVRFYDHLTLLWKRPPEQLENGEFWTSLLLLHDHNLNKCEKMDGYVLSSFSN